MQLVPFPIQQLLESGMIPNGQAPARVENLDPVLIHTREQIGTLLEVVSSMETLVKKPDRPKDEEDGPTVMLPEKHSADSASAIVMAASNRLIAIINDDSRWENTPPGVPHTKAEKETAAIIARTQAEEAQQSLVERKHQHAMQKKVEKAKTDLYCRQIEKTDPPALQIQTESPTNEEAQQEQPQDLSSVKE